MLDVASHLTWYPHSNHKFKEKNIKFYSYKEIWHHQHFKIISFVATAFTLNIVLFTRFVNAVYPSDDDDVITSPYNSVLAMNKLTEFADCVMPVENNSLIRMVKACNKYSESTTNKQPNDDKSKKPFDAMNDIVANLLLNLTR